MKNFFKETIPEKYTRNIYGCNCFNVGMENTIGRLCETILYNSDDALRIKISPRVKSKLLRYDKSIKLLKSCYRDLSEYEQNTMLYVFYQNIIPDIYGDKSIKKSDWECDFDDIGLDLSDIERKLWKQIQEDVIGS